MKLKKTSSPQKALADLANFIKIVSEQETVYLTDLEIAGRTFVAIREAVRLKIVENSKV